MANKIEVEATKYSDDLTSALVECPNCNVQSQHEASEWTINTNGLFEKDLWYGVECSCRQRFTFALSKSGANKTFVEQLNLSHEQYG
ncbi:hypothetical protein [Vibrio splendidus]|uniref:hypothetical protein n=1 Tax=Vibrio splendidus TaxID=29497 RepID=UPI003D0AA47A